MPRIDPAPALLEAAGRTGCATRARAPRRSASIAGVPALAALATAPVLLGACGLILGIEDLGPADAGATYRIGGIATGVEAPFSLWLEHPGGNEMFTVVRDGPFRFFGELPAGDPYLVRFVQNPPCVLTNANGIVGQSPDVEVACGPVLLETLSITGLAVPDIEFSPGKTRYDVRVSVAQQRLQLTAAAASAGASITVNGEPLASGETSVALAPGDTYIDIVVTAGTATRTYQIVVHRAEPLVQARRIKAPDAFPGDQLGYAMGVSGSRVALGAPGEDSAAQGVDGVPGTGAPNSGAAYVINHSDGRFDAYVKATNTGPGDEFGHSVDIDGDVLVVGAPYEDGSARGVDGPSDEAAPDSGAAYVYRYSGGSWKPEAYLKASNTGAGDNFGWSVAVEGDTIVVGARAEDGGSRGVGGEQEDDSVSDAGAVYVFRHTGAAWVQEAYLKASNTGREDNFGRNLTMHGDTLAVSARFEDSSSRGVNGNQENDQAVNSGAVYVFRRSGTIWDQEAYIKASNTGYEDNFGLSLALLGDTLAVGAPEEDSGATGVNGTQDNEAATGSGAVYVFQRTGATWVQQAYLKASNTGAGDNFGWSVDLAGDTLVVGAIGEDSAAAGGDGNQNDNTAADAGAAYLFAIEDGVWKQTTYVKPSNTGAGDWFGYTVGATEERVFIAAIYEDTSPNEVEDGSSDSGMAYELR